MSKPLADLRRIVTSHNQHGIAVIESDTQLIAEEMESIKGGKSTSIWITTDTVPTNDNNNEEDGATRHIEDSTNYGLVSPHGTNFRLTELAPGAITPMVELTVIETASAMLISNNSTVPHPWTTTFWGKLVLITEDGKETRLETPGDTVIQKGTLHAWKNPSQGWTRWMTVLIAAHPAVVNGMVLDPAFLLATPEKSDPV